MVRLGVKLIFSLKTLDGICDKQDYRQHKKMVNTVLRECTKTLILLMRKFCSNFIDLFYKCQMLESNFGQYPLQKSSLADCSRKLNQTVKAFEVC